MSDQVATSPRLVSFPKLESEFGIGYSRMHIDRLEKAGAFPKRIKIGSGGGPTRVAWLAEEVADWISARAAARDGGAE